MTEPSPAEQFEAWLKANPPTLQPSPQPTLWHRIGSVLFYIGALVALAWDTGLMGGSEGIGRGAVLPAVVGQ